MASSFVRFAAELGIPMEIIEEKNLIEYEEAQDLVVAEVGAAGTEHLLVPEAARAWRELKASASEDGFDMFIVSAFRSVERQAQIIRRKLSAGIPLEKVLSVSAPPGCSEHHTGRAVDLTVRECAPLKEEFAKTEAFSWLQANAGRFGFRLSFPLGNIHGYAYEPWHWFYQSS